MPSHRLLLAENFEPFRRVKLQKQIEFQVAEASDRLEAVQKAKDQRPDLILLDIGLPNLNGFEAARQMRELANPPKILSLQALGRRPAIRAGAITTRQNTVGPT